MIIELCHILGLRPRRVFVSQSIKSPFQTVDAGRITVRVLIAMIAVVPVENVKTSIRPGLLNHRHEPRIVGTEQIGFGRCLVRRFKPFDAVCVDATAMDVAHVKFLAILLRIRIAVVPVNATIRRLLMLVADDAFDLPRERRIRASLAMVVACFCQMPQMIDHTRADEGFSVIVKRNAPRVAGAFAK